MGLLRGMARTAVVAGTATAVSNRVSRRQAERWSAEEQASAPPPTNNQNDDNVAKLQQLADLKNQGVLTEQEFAAQKAKILG